MLYFYALIWYIFSCLMQPNCVIYLHLVDIWILLLTVGHIWSSCHVIFPSSGTRPESCYSDWCTSLFHFCCEDVLHSNTFGNLLFQIKRNSGSKFAIALYVAFAFLVITARQIMLKKKNHYQGSVADLVRRGQLRSDRRGMYVLQLNVYWESSC